MTMAALGTHTTPINTLETGLKSLLQPYIGDLKYKEMVHATRQAFYNITEDLRDMGMTWAQVTELTGAPRTTITSISAETVKPVAFKNRFMTELRRRPNMRMSRTEAALLYYQMCDEEDALTHESEELRRKGLDTFLKALRSMGLITLLKDRRRTVEATSASDSTISKRPETNVMESIRQYGSRIVDAVLARSPRRSARMYRTQFDILPEDIGEFLETWKEQTIALVRQYEAKAKAHPERAEPYAVVYGGATQAEISGENS